MKYWVIYVQHSERVTNNISRILFDSKEKAIEVAKELKGIIIVGEWVDIPKHVASN